MRKVSKIIAALVLSLVFLTSAFACGPGEKDKSGLLGYDVNRDNMFGICAVPNLGYSSSVDPGVTSEIVCDLMNIMGVKSARVWMHVTYVLEREKTSNVIKIKPKAAETFHKYFAELKAAGVENILAMNHMYIYPVEVLRPTHHGVVPDPGSDEYMIFLEMQQEAFRVMSAEFPEITQWEPNNETDHPRGASVVKQGYKDGQTAANTQYLYSMEEVADITADLCYYTNLGIKATNPDNVLVMPGLLFESSSLSATFIDMLYASITSGRMPTSYDYDGNRKIPTDNVTDNYFNVLNWHPYANVKPNNNWLQANIDMYNVAIKYGDKGKKLYITEFGWYDSHNDWSAEYIQQRTKDIGDWYPEAFDMLKEALPYLESVFVFRMFNWMSTGENVKEMEKTFGIFTSPVESTGIIPKPAAIGIYKYFNGPDADLTPLYKYRNKTNMPDIPQS